MHDLGMTSDLDLHVTLDQDLTFSIFRVGCDLGPESDLLRAQEMCISTMLYHFCQICTKCQLLTAQAATDLLYTFKSTRVDYGNQP